MLNTISQKLIPGLFALMLVNTTHPTCAQMHHKKSHRKKTAPSAIMQGKSLVANANCMSCHRLDVKLIGPAFKDIAAKYPANQANYDQLSTKVIAGGSGNWGEVPMSPHPDLKPDDAKKMVEYILSIK